jgi:NAD(P)-dependent dehydrogenase (short-subunit alcohol dehydrogenase family)
VRRWWPRPGLSSGDVTGLFHCAGISGYGSAITLKPDTWHRVIEVNLTGAWHCARAVLPDLVVNGGAIVNIASVAGVSGVRLSTCYAASKADVIGLSRQIAIDYAADGVRCNAICPGTVPTPMVARGIKAKSGGDDDALAREYTRRKSTFPLQRLGTVDDVASLGLFLLSSEAA